MSDSLRIGVDTGGTFTDLVAARGDQPAGSEQVVKLPSTPSAPGSAVVAGLERALAASGAQGATPDIVHGTTVGLNALLTGRLARTAFVTDAGLEGWIEVGRQTRDDLYALEPNKPSPLAPRELRFGVRGRLVPDGPTGVRAEPGPSDEELAELARRIASSGAESIAIGLLHAYADPDVERRVARALEGLGLPITCSASLLPEYREHERFETALVNAALAPTMQRYLAPLEERVRSVHPDAHLSLLQSAGGSLPSARAAVEPVRVLLSGPAGGVIGAAQAARDLGFERLVALDMGGTSADVAFARTGGEGLGSAEGGAARRVRHVAGRAIAVPCLDMVTIGCGGGSLAHLDVSSVLHVGPESAGADPGPVAYGNSDRPTVTDAHVQLGHVASGAFLGGELELDTAAVARAFEELGRRLGASADRAAQAVLDAARASMRRAVGVMTFERGQDPREVPLVAFGGAGGLHAVALATSLGQPCAVVPRHPGALSAFGMTRATALVECTRTLLADAAEVPAAELDAYFAELTAEARAQLAEETGGSTEPVCERELDLRYRGQSSELRLTAGPDLPGRFAAAHERLFGYRLTGAPLELVCLRVRARQLGALGLGDSTEPALQISERPATPCLLYTSPSPRDS